MRITNKSKWAYYIPKVCVENDGKSKGTVRIEAVYKLCAKILQGCNTCERKVCISINWQKSMKKNAKSALEE